MGRKRTKIRVQVKDGKNAKYSVQDKEYNRYKEIFKDFPKNKYSFKRISTKTVKTTKTTKSTKTVEITVYGAQFIWDENDKRYWNKKEYLKNNKTTQGFEK